MSCNTCCKTFSLIRKEKGCPGCGFSHCSKCLKYKIFIPKLNCESMVCIKCNNSLNSRNKVIEPPAAYFKRIENTGLVSNDMNIKNNDPIDEEIKKRLLKLKEEKLNITECSNEDITERLTKLKDIPSTSQTELEQRLANIKEIPLDKIQSKPFLLTSDLRTEEEQANDLLKQYMAQASIDKKYDEGFNSKITDIEERLQKLKGSTTSNNISETVIKDSEDDIIKKIINKAIIESDDEIASSVNEELPFCEICNEDAEMRCLGCKYLFCKKCFIEHKDDEGCDRYEKYTSPLKP